MDPFDSAQARPKLVVEPETVLNGGSLGARPPTHAADNDRATM